ncbi:hypothetical protein BD769DRAFT_1355639 [Suillus cothurnatus]|nr:hypothetical protein BD769DRAFT_1355639 [Suillus cothurnatus]
MIPLVISMPVMIGQNFDVSVWIVNGCVSTLQSIRFFMDDNSNLHATSCVIHTPSTSGDPLPHLTIQ